MRLLLTAIFSLGLLLASLPGRAESALEFGLAPYISTRTLLGMFKPLSAFLERRLERPVMLVSAPDLENFDRQLIGQQYDIAIVAPHTARLAQRDHGYEPLLRFSSDLYGVLLVKAGSPVQNVRELAGLVIAFPQRTSATALLGQELLEKYGVGMSHVERPHSFQDSVLLGLTQGEYPAALVNAFVLHQAPESQRLLVKQIAQTRKISNLIIVARADLSRPGREALQAAITEFMETTPEGAKFLKETGLAGVRPVSDTDLKNLDSLAADQRRIWEELRLGQRQVR
ncbi:MAG: phosphate/phosphite/phosphonate ABC transporter substrate-binding protein [Burkholderiales bacterium]